MERSEDTRPLAFLFGLLLLQISVYPCLFGALYMLSIQKQPEGWYLMALGYTCMGVSKLLTRKKESKDGTHRKN